MNIKPAASIIIPVYNRSKLVLESIKSAQQQTIENIEIIVIDNASTDGTYESCQEHALLDSRVRIFRNDTNIGPVMNWKKGVTYATADFSKLLFSDDLIEPKYLEKCLPPLPDPSCGLVYTPARISPVPHEGRVFYDSFLGDTKIRKTQFIYASTFIDGFTPVSPGACICRTNDLNKNIHLDLTGYESPLFASTGAGVDWLIYALTALQYEYVQYIDSCEVYFRAHNRNLSSEAGVPECYANAKRFLVSALGMKNTAP